MQPDNVAQGDLGLKGNSNSIMKPKKNPGAQFNAADITQNDGKCMTATIYIILLRILSEARKTNP